MAAWSDAARLQADVERLGVVVGRAADRAYGHVDDLVFEVMKALGLTRIGRTFPWSLPVFDWPFSSLMFNVGPALQARSNNLHRAAGVKCIPPVEPWETSALTLEAELWASSYRADVDVAALAIRAANLLTACLADSRPPQDTTMPETTTDPPTLDEASLFLLARLESRLASGIVPAHSEEAEERRYADARATGPEPNFGVQP